MYLPLETTFAIFIGGLTKGVFEMISKKRKFKENQVARMDNVGILLAAGLIAGEALVGLIFATLAFFDIDVFHIFKHPSFLSSLVVFAIIIYVLIQIPLKNAGNPDQPAPQSAAH